MLSPFVLAGESSVTEALNEFFSNAAKEINEDLPEMVDDFSRLERVSYSDLIFTHHYTVVGLSESEFRRDYPDQVLKDFYSGG
jgi:hypothetical protein